MEFETCAIPPNSKDFVKEFLEELEDHPDPNKTTAYKISDKLVHFGDLNLGQLMRAEHIKHLEEDVYEVRIRIKNVKYRFLGYIKGTTFFMVHATIKKWQKALRKDIELAKERIKLVKNENQGV